MQHPLTDGAHPRGRPPPLRRCRCGGLAGGAGGDVLAPPALRATVLSSSATASLGVAAILTLSAHNPGPGNRSKRCRHSRLWDPARAAQSRSLTCIPSWTQRETGGAPSGEVRLAGSPGARVRRATEVAAPGLPCDRRGGSLNLPGPLLAAVSWGGGPTPGPQSQGRFRSQRLADCMTSKQPSFGASLLSLITWGSSLRLLGGPRAAGAP